MSSKFKELLEILAITGFICLSDNPTSHSNNENEFNYSQIALEKLIEYINKSSHKNLILNLTTPIGRNLNKLFNTNQHQWERGTSKF